MSDEMKTRVEEIAKRTKESLEEVLWLASFDGFDTIDWEDEEELQDESSDAYRVKAYCEDQGIDPEDFSDGYEIASEWLDNCLELKTICSFSGRAEGHELSNDDVDKVQLTLSWGGPNVYATTEGRAIRIEVYWGAEARESIWDDDLVNAFNQLVGWE